MANRTTVSITSTLYTNIIRTMMQGNFSTAQKMLESLVGSPFLKESLSSRLFLSLGMIDESKAAELRAINHNSYVLTLSGRARHLGNAAFVAKRLIEANAYYQIAKECDPTDMRIDVNISALHMCAEQWTEALQAALSALHIGLVFGIRASLLSRTLERILSLLKRPDVSYRPQFVPEQSFGLMVLASNPCSTAGLADERSNALVYEVECYLAYSLAKAKLYAVADKHLSSAILLRPDEGCAYLAIAACRLHMGDYAVVVNNTRCAIAAKKPAQPAAQAYWLQGLGLFGMESYEAAGEALLAAAEMEPQNSAYANSVKVLTAPNPDQSLLAAILGGVQIDLMHDLALFC